MKRSALKNLVVKQDPENPIPAEILAKSIQDIAAGMARIRTTRLNDKAVEFLIHHASGVPVTQVRLVLNSLDNLEAVYLKPRKKQ